MCLILFGTPSTFAGLGVQSDPVELIVVVKVVKFEHKSNLYRKMLLFIVGEMFTE